MIHFGPRKVRVTGDELMINLEGVIQFTQLNIVYVCIESQRTLKRLVKVCTFWNSFFPAASSSLLLGNLPSSGWGNQLRVIIKDLTMLRDYMRKQVNQGTHYQFPPQQGSLKRKFFPEFRGRCYR
jgi:hypothetical protein